MKAITLALILFTNMGSVIILKNQLFDITLNKNKISNEPNSELVQSNKSLTIQFNKHTIELIPEKDDLNLLEQPIIKGDTLYIFGPDINELKSIKLKDLKSNEYSISQMYESTLILQFDGKSFEMKDWKKYQSEWFSAPTEGKIRKYKETDYKRFPNYNKSELLEALNINKNNISNHWYNFVINNLDNENSGIYFEPTINKTIFKIEILGKRNLYIKLQHMIGC